ncbi:MAG TPA: twin-arginine translocation signal domain-containing protein, partial [Planctomycetaceae bacterium]|nr:twin-arginine translocation signal domain-containing protein [Planctomycetaceae bacterium]
MRRRRSVCPRAGRGRLNRRGFLRGAAVGAGMLAAP